MVAVKERVALITVSQVRRRAVSEPGLIFFLSKHHFFCLFVFVSFFPFPSASLFFPFFLADLFFIHKLSFKIEYKKLRFKNPRNEIAIIADVICEGKYAIIREGRITFLENDRRQTVLPDQVYSLLVVCQSLFLHGNKLYDVMFIHQVYFGKFLSSHAFTNLRSCQLESHVCRDSKSLYK